MARADRGGVGQSQGHQALRHRETIVALSSGRLPAAIAVLRISGPDALAAVTSVAGALPTPRHASLRALRDADGELLDRALVLVFPGDRSATGEDLVELHCHGGRAVVAAVEQALLACDGVRPADPGEFTRRALLNGRIDLTQAQGLSDLLAAETETERRLAIRNAEGAVRRLIEGWMTRLTAMAAQIEASIDFAEEGDVVAEADSLATVDRARQVLVEEIGDVLAAPPIERWRDGWRIVIAGPPNAGKSTLINLLSQRNVAIVSAISGTTRDRIDAPVQRNGIGYVLTDTAGLRDETDDPIERAGIGRARDAIGSADCVVWLGDNAPDNDTGAIWVHARSDLPDRKHPPAGTELSIRRDDRDSVERLWTLIETRIVRGVSLGQPALPRGDRAACFDVAQQLSCRFTDQVLAAEAIRGARVGLGRVLGIDATENLLDQVFATFCLGK